MVFLVVFFNGFSNGGVKEKKYGERKKCSGGLKI